MLTSIDWGKDVAQECVVGLEGFFFLYWHYGFLGSQDLINWMESKVFFFFFQKWKNVIEEGTVDIRRQTEICKVNHLTLQ